MWFVGGYFRATWSPVSAWATLRDDIKKEMKMDIFFPVHLKVVSSQVLAVLRALCVGVTVMLPALFIACSLQGPLCTSSGGLECACTWQLSLGEQIQCIGMSGEDQH